MQGLQELEDKLNDVSKSVRRSARRAIDKLVIRGAAWLPDNTRERLSNLLKDVRG